MESDEIEIGFIGLMPQAEWFFVSRGSTLGDFLKKLNKYRNPENQLSAADCYYDKPYLYPIEAIRPINGITLVYVKKN